MKKRLFLAIWLPKTYLAVLDKYEKETPFANWQFIPLKNLHLTINFLGSVDVGVIADLIQKLKDALSVVFEFNLQFDKIIFVPSQKPRMLWMTFKKNRQFQKLVESVAKSTEEYVGLKTIYPVTAHVTLVRFKVAPDIKLKQPKIKDNLHVTSCHLVESKPAPLGPIYSSVEVFKLAS